MHWLTAYVLGMLVGGGVMLWLLSLCDLPPAFWQGVRDGFALRWCRGREDRMKR